MEAPEPIPYAQAHPDPKTDQRRQDDAHLQAVVICHYILGGLLAVFAVLPLIHIGIGIAMITGTLDEGGDAPPRWFGWVFVGMGAFTLVAGETLAILNLYSARQVSQRRRRTLSLVVAGFDCLLMPLGTALGVFTFIVLLRESVRRQYEEAAG